MLLNEIIREEEERKKIADYLGPEYLVWEFTDVDGVVHMNLPVTDEEWVAELETLDDDDVADLVEDWEMRYFTMLAKQEMEKVLVEGVLPREEKELVEKIAGKIFNSEEEYQEEWEAIKFTELWNKKENEDREERFKRANLSGEISNDNAYFDDTFFDELEKETDKIIDETNEEMKTDDFVGTPEAIEANKKMAMKYYDIPELVYYFEKCAEGGGGISFEKLEKDFADVEFRNKKIEDIHNEEEDEFQKWLEGKEK